LIDSDTASKVFRSRVVFKRPFGAPSMMRGKSGELELISRSRFSIWHMIQQRTGRNQRLTFSVDPSWRSITLG